MAQNRGAELLEKLPDVDLIVGTHGNFTRCRIARLASAPRAGSSACKVGETIVDIAEEAGSQNTIRTDHVLAQDDAGQPDAGACRSAPSFRFSRAATWTAPSASMPKNCAVATERSRPMDDIVAECHRASGTRRAGDQPLLGQIVTSYGRRRLCAHRRDFAFRAIRSRRVHALDGSERIRFTSPHPRGFKQDLVEAYGRLPKLCGYVHLPRCSRAAAGFCAR